MVIILTFVELHYRIFLIEGLKYLPDPEADSCPRLTPRLGGVHLYSGSSEHGIMQ
jgi:hypothetical protein